MVAKLTVIFFILLCLMVGTSLVLLPWLNLNKFGDWGDNYLLAVIAQKTGWIVLQKAVASSWIRGAVTGLGILNLFMAFWEIANFSRGVKMLEQENGGIKN
ncbi:MAG: hypothetical protein ACR2N3_18885 [Pyrinomonadaceae bacterium]